MIVAAAGGQQRPRYVLGIAVAVLIVVAYVLVGSKPAVPVPTPSPLPSFVTVVAPLASALIGPPHFDTSAPIPTNENPTQPPSPGPTRHLHSGPPLH